MCDFASKVGMKTCVKRIKVSMKMCVSILKTRILGKKIAHRFGELSLFFASLCSAVFVG